MPVLLHTNLQTRLLSDSAPDDSRAVDAQSGACDLPSGTRLQNGAFVLEDVLGRGGFGITYRARDCRDGRTVAIKEYFPSGCVRVDNIVQPRGATSDSGAQMEAGFAAMRFDGGKRQFLEEARVLIGLRHPNIVQVQSAFEDLATAYLVMEHLEGRTLLEQLEKSGPLPADEAISIIEKVAQALEAVHRLGMLHLDIKPENVFRCDLDGRGVQSEEPANARGVADSKRNETRRVVLMDFDLMRRIESAATYQTRVLSHTSHCGTPGYAPIEQYAQGARFGTPTDIYALGATFYHLLTGVSPLAATDRAHREIVQGNADEPIFLRSVATPAREAIARAMQIRPERRPQTVREFLDILHGKALPVSDSRHMSTHAAALPANLTDCGAASPIAASIAMPVVASNGVAPSFSHSAPHASIVSGDWHRVTLKANVPCEWPLSCACCGAADEGFLSVSASKNQAKANRGKVKNAQTWQVPYCRICLRHVQAAKNAVSVAMNGMGCGLSLAVVGLATSNLYVGPLGVFVHFTSMAYWVLKHVFAEQTATPKCCDTREAVACTDSGHATVWKFKNLAYAAAFRQLNAAAVI